MTQKASYQSIVLKLQDFWASHGGTLITQPYYTQVGAREGGSDKSKH